MRVNGVQNGRNVTVTQNDLRCPAKGIEIEKGKQPCGAVAPAKADNAVEIGVSEGGVQIGRALLVCPCEVLIAAEQVRPKSHFVAEGTKKRRAGLDGDVFFQITGRGQERDPGPRGEAPGTKGGGPHRRAL